MQCPYCGDELLEIEDEDEELYTIFWCDTCKIDVDMDDVDNREEEE